jgi:MoxR-like ATPase
MTQTHTHAPALSERDAQTAAPAIARVIDEVERVVVGQRTMVSGLVLGLLTNGHVLLEGVPGLAKTLTVSTLARVLHATFSRIQFTPDLLPADLIGTLIYNPADHTFTPRKGPVFANIVLADEINRAPAKVQSALLEAMQERQVTIGDRTFPIPDPFLVLATQNPIEQEGTYPLPEAQVDRFMLKIRVGYPGMDAERAILDRHATTTPHHEVSRVLDLDELRRLRAMVDAVHAADAVRDYIVRLVHATRNPAALPGRAGESLANLIEFGASPRASIALLLAARAHALMDARTFATPSDVKAIALDVLRHRVIPSYEAQAEDHDSDSLVQRILDAVPVP